MSCSSSTPTTSILLSMFCVVGCLDPYNILFVYKYNALIRHHTDSFLTSIYSNQSAIVDCQFAMPGSAQVSASQVVCDSTWLKLATQERSHAGHTPKHQIRSGQVLPSEKPTPPSNRSSIRRQDAVSACHVAVKSDPTVKPCLVPKIEKSSILYHFRLFVTNIIQSWIN